MLIIPAVDIRGGKCVRLWQGNYERETVYGDDPAAMARKWIEQGASFLHIVDLDGARDGIPHNKSTIEEIARRSSVPVQVGGGIRDLATIDDYLAAGIQRIILGTVAYTRPLFLKEACGKWPGRVAVDIAALEDKAAVAGWLRKTEIPALELARRCAELGASAIIYTDISRDGTRKGVNVPKTREMAVALQVPLIVSGGVSSLEDIKALLPLEKEGVCGVIVGRALYAGDLNLPEAMALAQGKGG